MIMLSAIVLMSVFKSDNGGRREKNMITIREQKLFHHKRIQNQNRKSNSSSSSSSI